MHRTNQDEKSANWMLQAAREADLDLDDEAKYEIQEHLGLKASKNADILDDKRIQDFKYDPTISRKRESKQ